MFQIAILGKVRCPIGCGGCPGNRGFSVQSVGGCCGDWTPYMGFPGLVLSLQGLVLICKTLFLLFLNHGESLEGLDR